MDAVLYKELSIKEFTKAAGVYETDRAGIYKMCKKDYPDVLKELEKMWSYAARASIIIPMYRISLTAFTGFFVPKGD